MIRKWKWPLLILLFLALAASGLSFYRFGDASVRGSKVLRIGTFSTAIDYSPFYIAQSQGWLEDAAKRHGMAIQYSRFDALPAINDALAARKLDIILEADTPAIVQKASGNELVEIAPLASLSQEMIIPKSSSAKSLQDLQGKKIAVLFGTGFHYGFISGINKSGIPPNAFTLVNLAPPEARAAFASSSVDGWYVWPPFPQQEEVAGTGKIIPGTSARVNVFMFANAEFARDNSALIDDIIAAIDRARQFIRENGNEAQAIVSRQTSFQPEVVALAWPKIDFNLTVTPQVVEEMNDQAAFLAQGNFISKPTNFPPSFFYRPGPRS
jgi:sulfonate transport system substrate-binding protein